MFEQTANIENPSREAIVVCFEPWGMCHQLLPGQSFRVVAASSIEGQLEIEQGSAAISVYGWQGSTMRVYRGEELIDEFSTEVPAFPPGMTAKSLIELLFRDPGMNAEPRGDN